MIILALADRLVLLIESRCQVIILQLPVYVVVMMLFPLQHDLPVN